ncbi:MAG: hypothetical protein U9P71_09365 [Campylobacterota bacterium]|nr:hypothetical protein [Campylobacterota bacterium]
MRLFKSLFHPYVWFRAIFSALLIGIVLYFIVMLYTTVVVEGILQTDIASIGIFFKLLFYILSLLGYLLSIYATVILFPIIYTLKVSFDADRYINYLARQFDVKLSPTSVTSKFKYFLLAVFYVVLSAFLALSLIIAVDDTPYEFLIIFALAPLYILIYKNWMYSLKRILGNDFTVVYEKHRGRFIRKGIFYIILMHIPFLFLLQPWFYILFANLYFKQRNQLPC